MRAARAAAPASALGELLRYWRGVRKRSQLELALEAGVSPRHVSFVETGRSQPSRDMVLRLAEVLDVPLRERNALLEAAGFAAVYRESDFFAPELGPVRKSIEFLLERHDPNPAALLDRHWNALLQNRSAALLLARLVEPAALRPPINLMRLLFQPDGMRPWIVNWSEVARDLIQRLHREVMTAASDARLRALRDDLLAMDGVPSDWRRADLAVPAPFVVPIHLRRDDLELSLFSALTTLGTVQDITLNELRLETFFPLDEPSEKALRAL